MILTTILSNISFMEEIVTQQHKTARQNNHLTVDTVTYHYLYFSHFLINTEFQVFKAKAFIQNLKV